LTTGGVKSANTGRLSIVPDNNSDDQTHTYVPLTNGTMVSHYRIVEEIGAGGMFDHYKLEVD
jgi:hypothetical protein